MFQVFSCLVLFLGADLSSWGFSDGRLDLSCWEAGERWFVEVDGDVEGGRRGGLIAVVSWE